MGTHRDTQQPKRQSALPSVPVHSQPTSIPRSRGEPLLFAPQLVPLSPSPPSSSTMAGPSRTTIVQPPRPPNAWILYRSDKLREMPPVPPGMPRRAQADVSREISQMWKNESEVVRSEYERLAEVRKAQHQNAYPGYRYHPISKAEKERLRDERRMEKERERNAQKKTRSRHDPLTTTIVLPTFASGLPYSADSQYGPCGPSPPLSAAPSPTNLHFPDITPLFDTQVQHQVPVQREGQPYTPGNALSLSIPGPSSAGPPHSRASSHSYAMNPIDAIPTAANSPASIPEQTPTPSSSLWKLPSTPATTSPTPPSGSTSWSGHATNSHSLSTPTHSGQNNWSGVNASGGQAPALNLPNPPVVEFSMPSGDEPSVQGWEPQSRNTDYQDSLQALLSGTGDPSIFELSGIDPTQLAANPGTEIEISFGQTGHVSMDATFAELFGNIDMSFLNAPEPNYGGEQLPLFAPQPHHAPSADHLSHSHHPSYDASSSSELFQYLNLDPSCNAPQTGPPHHSQMHHQSHSVPPAHDVSPSHPQHQPYIPPAGAAHASRRHVGATWRPSALALPDSPVERSASAPWEVPAN